MTKLALLTGAVPWREAVNILHGCIDPCVGVVETLAYFTNTDIMVIHLSNQFRPEVFICRAESGTRQ